jgi:sortase (surface protein transpeptidase)
VGGTRTIRPVAGLLLSIALPAAAAGGTAAWLSHPDRAIGLAPAAKSAKVKAPTVEALVAALSLDPRQAKRHLKLRARIRHHAEAPGRPAEPASISIPSADASGPVDRMGVRDGTLQIPPPGRAGWFDAGPRPGELGRSVIVSHVDTKEGPALFFNLLKLQRGSPVTVRDRRGALHRFAVVRRRQVDKKRFSPAAVYGDAAHPTLVLITCGGPFSPDTGYRDNVILWARAV